MVRPYHGGIPRLRLHLWGLTAKGRFARQSFTSMGMRFSSSVRGWRQPMLATWGSARRQQHGRCRVARGGRLAERSRRPLSIAHKAEIELPAAVAVFATHRRDGVAVCCAGGGRVAPPRARRHDPEPKR